MLQQFKPLKRFSALGAVAQGLLRPEKWENNVVMLHEGRCGSSVLAGLLGQHSAIQWEGEVFGVFKPGGALARYFRYNYPLLYLRQRIARSEHSIYGFETKVRLHLWRKLDLSLREYLRGLQNLGFSRYIVLDRKNGLRRIASSLISVKTKKWAVSKREKPRLVQIELELDEIISWLEELQRISAELEEVLSDRALLWLTYEDHVAPDPRIGYRRVCEFLDLPPEEVAVTLKKVNPFPLSEMIENYEEVRRGLSGTDFEWMLEE